MYSIYDWAMNELTAHGTFSTFDDAWCYIMTNFSESDYEELLVEPSSYA